MSAAAATADAAVAAPAKKGKKKLVLIVAAALVLLLLIGGGTVFFLKKKAAHAAEADGDEAVAEHQEAKPDLARPPTFLPLDTFVVNLADRDADRYAQIGITLEVEDKKFAEQMKAFMPAIRNGILLILAQKTSRELLERSGKEQLATEIRNESARAVGITVVAEPLAAPAQAQAHEPNVAATAPDADDDKPKASKKAPAAEPNPIRRVHFSNFIVQ